MFDGMDTSYGGFMATQGTTERKSNVRARGSAWIPVLASDVWSILPGSDAIRRGTFESSEVTLVGVIRSSERKMNMASIDYYVDDNSGPPILVHHLIEEEREGNVIPVADNTYVRVVGKVRTWGNQRGITAFSILPLKNLNELTMHILEVTYCKMFYAKDILRRREERAQNKVLGAGGGAPMAAGGSTMTGASAYTASSKMMTNPPAAISSGLSGVNGEIHKFLSLATTDKGYSLADIQRRFPHLGQAKIREHLELLSSEGHVYTTVDDDHYKTTDS